MYIIASWRLNNEQYYWNEGASITVKVGNTTVISKSIAKNESWSVQAVVNNVSSWAVVQATIVPPSRWGNAGAYWENRIWWTIGISATQSGIIKPLIATEEVGLGEQGMGTSYGRLPDGTRYGEFDDVIHTTATTGSITLGNCIWFKVITDANGEQFKVPVYWI